MHFEYIHKKIITFFIPNKSCIIKQFIATPIEFVFAFIYFYISNELIK